MSGARLTAEKRREAIVRAALPLFAMDGFASATTKKLAAAAGVSEALIYKHFPSKESLYAEIQKHGCKGCDPMLHKLTDLEPSTSTLVYIVYYLVRENLLIRLHHSDATATRQRMILNSCLEDGSFSRLLFQNRLAENIGRIEACLRAAEAAGDMIRSSITRQNRILFVHHLAVMIAIMHLPSRPVIDYKVSKEKLLHETMLFGLRGMGLTDKAIRRCYNPRALARFFGGQSR